MAGQVINSIGTFSVSGNFIVGLVVFSILIVVQYVVVTSGAQRVSEVAARFTLDSMPGQQMSIDADLNMGLIDQKEAIARRKELEKEAAFYGSMDGASKFVKGDAIAGIIIILIDIIAGWIIGVVQMGMGWSEALQKFTLLTIGDGIATQLPALIIAIATGIIVTRSSADKELSIEVFKQLSSVVRIPIIVAGVLFAMMLMPGMPKWPIFIIIGVSLLIWLRIRKRDNAIAKEDTKLNSEEEAPDTISKPFPLLEIALGSELSEAWKSNEVIIMDRIANLRETHEKTLGLGFPSVKLIDGTQMGSYEYEIRLFGTTYASGEIESDKVLAIQSEKTTIPFEGETIRDPAFGLPALWIDENLAEQAREKFYTVVDPITVLITHLGELLQVEAATLLTRSIVTKLLEEVRDRQSGLVEELIPNILTVSDIQRLLQNLLSEKVSIANIDMIFEHLVDLARNEKDVGELTERIRQRMNYAICNKLRDKNPDLAVISLDPKAENQILMSTTASSDKDRLAIEPKLAQQLLTQLIEVSGKMHTQGRNPVLLCGSEIRRQMRALTKRSIPKLSILSVNEIPMNINLKSFEVIKLEQ